MSAYNYTDESGDQMSLVRLVDGDVLVKTWNLNRSGPYVRVPAAQVETMIAKLTEPWSET